MIKFVILQYLLLNSVYNQLLKDVNEMLQGPNLLNCKIQVDVQTEYNSEEKDIKICQECNDNYIVSKNFNTCLHFIDQIGQQGFLNCQRIDHTGSCAEAFVGIDIVGRDYFSFITRQIFADRCAKIDPSYTICNYPRFGYVLDFKKQNLWYDIEETYCALFDSELNKCVEYFAGFIIDEEISKTLFLGDQFIHPEQVLQNGKGFRNIECKENFEFVQINEYKLDVFDNKHEIKVLIGCFQKGNSQNQLDKGIENCLEYFHNQNICKQCNEGYSLSSDKQQCKMITLNCVEYEIYFGEEICSKCKPFYKKEYRECVIITNCIQISETDQNQCTGCSLSYFLNYQNSCQPTIKQISNDCFVRGQSEYDCQKCIISESFYFSYEKGKCVPREKSQNCAKKSNDTDECLTQECEDGYFFYQSKSSNSYDSQALDEYDINSSKALENMKIKYNISLKKLLYWFIRYECKKRKNITITDCEKYNPVQDNCLYCKKGYQKVAEKNSVDKNLIEYSCIKIQQPIQQKKAIENCIQYDEVNQVCLKCKQYYFYDYKQDECAKIDNCLIPAFKQSNNYQRLSTCIICRKGYVKNDKLQCENCNEIKNLKITEYKTSQLVDGKEICNFKQKPCFKEHQGKCYICYKGYILDKRSYQCIRDINYPNCSVIDEITYPEDNSSNQNESKENDQSDTKNKIKCISCNSGYILDKGVCICQLQSCLGTYLCKDDLSCFKRLNRGYKQIPGQLQSTLQLSNQYYINNLVNNSFEKCQLANCEICKYGDQCYLCKKEYFYDKKQKKCIERCNSGSCIDTSTFNNQYQTYPCKEQKNIQSKSICTKCMDYSQFITSDGFCQDQCPMNYTQTLVNNEIKVCYKCPQNCLECTFDQLLFFTNGKIKCLACSTGKFLFQNNCYNECPYYQDENKNCREECPQDTFISGKECLKKCPNFYSMIDKQQRKTCVDQCNEKTSLYYPDQPFYCAKQCDDGYIADDQDKRCLKCSDKNCKECQMKNQSQCIQCFNDYFLNEDKQCKYKCSNGEIVSESNECQLKCKLPYCQKCSENHQFCEKCLNGFSLSSNLNCECEYGKFINEFSAKCEFCHPKCISCSEKEGCTQCSQETYLIPITSSVNKQNKIIYTCTSTCPIGTYPAPAFSSPEFSKLHAACLKCPQTGCISCKSSTECLDCQGKFYLKYDQQTNQYSCECKLGYFFDGNNCKFKCSNLRIVEHEQDCCNVENCDSCPRNIDSCEKCNSLYPYLVENKCMRKCPDGTFESEGKNCEKCNQLCLTCEKSSSQCTSCRLPTEVSDVKNKCQCNLGLYYFQGKCVSQCPLYSYVKLNLKICELYCSNEQQFPIFNEKHELVSCDKINNSSDSNFCEQHISNLLDLIKFELITESDSLKDNQIKLNIKFTQTPFNCYEYKLRGKENFYITIQSNENQSNQKSFYLASFLNKSDFNDPKQIVCNQNFCYLNLEVYLNKVLRLTLKIKLNIQLNAVGVEGIKDSQVISNTVSSIISLSSIDNKLILPSFQNIECPSESFCSFRNITTHTNKTIFITITAIQQNLQPQNILEILSIYFVQENKQIEPIKNFYYENFFSNILKIIITFHNEMSGQLVIVSNAKQKVINNQLNDSQDKIIQQNPQYLTSIFDLNIKNKQKISDDNKQPSIEKPNEKEPIVEQQNEQYSTLISSVFLFNTLVSFLIFIYFIFKIYDLYKEKRKRSNFKPMIEERNDSVSIELR